MNWKTCSVEAGDGISKRSAIRVVLLALKTAGFALLAWREFLVNFAAGENFAAKNAKKSPKLAKPSCGSW
jgi:hypothetical protein